MRPEWIELTQQLETVLARYGSVNPFDDGDCSLADDDWGDDRVEIVINNKGMLKKSMFEDLAGVLRRFDAFYVAVHLMNPKGDLLDEAFTVTYSGYAMRVAGQLVERFYGSTP